MIASEAQAKSCAQTLLRRKGRSAQGAVFYTLFLLNPYSWLDRGWALTTEQPVSEAGL